MWPTKYSCPEVYKVEDTRWLLDPWNRKSGTDLATETYKNLNYGCNKVFMKEGKEINF